MAGYLGRPSLQASLGAVLKISPEEVHEHMPPALAAAEASLAQIMDEVAIDAQCVDDAGGAAGVELGGVGGAGGVAAATAAATAAAMEAENLVGDSAGGLAGDYTGGLVGAAAGTAAGAAVGAVAGAAVGGCVLDYERALAQIGGDPLLLQRMLTHFASYSLNIPADMHSAVRTDMCTRHMNGHVGMHLRWLHV